MTPDWPSLWDREPGLRPSNLRCAPDAGEPRGSSGKPVPDCEIRLESMQWRECEDSTAAALCRDAASKYLAHWPDTDDFEGPLGVEIIGSDFDWRVTLLGWEEPSVFTCDTRDAALFAACKAVLDARDKR